MSIYSPDKNLTASVHKDDVMSRTLNFSSQQQLQQMHQAICALQQLADHPDLVMLYQGKAWDHKDFMTLSIRFTALAQQQGLDVSLYQQWFRQNQHWLADYGLQEQWAQL